MRAAAPDWDRLLDHLVAAGPSGLDDLQVELGLKPKELKGIRLPLERCGAIVSRSLQVTAGEGHAHSSELWRWDQVYSGAGDVDVHLHLHQAFESCFLRSSRSRGRARARAEALVLVAVVLGRHARRRPRPRRTTPSRRAPRDGGRVIRPMDLARDAPGVVEIIDEVFPAGVTTVESWRQQHESIPPRARQAGWVAVVDGTVVGRAEASLNWFTESRSAFAGVSVRRAFRGQGIGSSLWELIRQHLDELAPSRVMSMFVETPEGVAFARARGFAEVRAETLSCVDPLTVDFTTLEAAPTKLVPLREVSPEEVYELDMVTTADVPMTEAITRNPLRRVAEIDVAPTDADPRRQLRSSRRRTHRVHDDARRQRRARQGIHRLHGNAPGVSEARARGQGEARLASLGGRKRHPGSLDDERRDECADACREPSPRVHAAAAPRGVRSRS